MVLFILAGVLLAVGKRYHVKKYLLRWELYPLYLTELVHMFFQLNAYFENYTYIRYATHLQKVFVLVLLIPILSRKIYGTAIAGAGLTVAGSMLNKLVIDANGGKMPVLPTLTKWTGFYKPGTLDAGFDALHIQMNADTKLNFLGDVIDTGFTILSVGDVLNHLFITIVVFYFIKSFANAKT